MYYVCSASLAQEKSVQKGYNVCRGEDVWHDAGGYGKEKSDTAACCCAGWMVHIGIAAVAAAEQAASWRDKCRRYGVANMTRRVMQITR